MRNQIKIIIAEDVDVIRNNYVEILSKDDELEVVGASSTGAGAIKLFKDVGADIILMDIEMETSNAGVMAAQEIFQLSNDVKIIFLTIREDEKTIISAMTTGAVDYMIKSDDGEKIISHIKKAHNDRVEFEREIQCVLHDECIRLAENNENLINFSKKLMLLTPSEREIIKLLLGNNKVKEIARARCVEPVTIKTQIWQMLRKFNVKRTKEIVAQIRELKMEKLFL